MLDSLQPHGLYPARLLCLWDFPGKNAGLSCFPSPGDFPDLGIEPTSPVLAGGFFTTETPGKSKKRTELVSNNCKGNWESCQEISLNNIWNPDNFSMKSFKTPIEIETSCYLNCAWSQERRKSFKLFCALRITHRLGSDKDNIEFKNLPMNINVEIWQNSPNC